MTGERLVGRERPLVGGDGDVVGFSITPLVNGSAAWATQAPWLCVWRIHVRAFVTGAFDFREWLFLEAVSPCRRRLFRGLNRTKSSTSSGRRERGTFHDFKDSKK